MIKLKSIVVPTFITLLAGVPLALRQKFAYLLGPFIAKLAQRESKIIEQQTRVFLPCNRPTPNQVFGAAACTFLETINLSSILQNSDQNITCSDWPLIRSLLAEQKGLIALTAHYSNWELLAAYMVKHEVPLTVIGREAHSIVLQQQLAKLRERYGIKTIWRTSHIARTLVQDLKNGRVCAALLDQDTRVQSVPINFFGFPAQTPVSLIHLAKRLDVQIVTAFIRRLPNKNFSVSVELIDNKLSAEEILEVYHNRLEREILLAPEQWVWFHKRWRTEPGGHRRTSKEYLDWLRSRTNNE